MYEESGGGGLPDRIFSDADDIFFDESVLMTWEHWILLDEQSSIDRIQESVGPASKEGDPAKTGRGIHDADDRPAPESDREPVVWFRCSLTIDTMALAGQLEIRQEVVQKTEDVSRKHSDPDVEYGPDMLWGE